MAELDRRTSADAAATVLSSNARPQGLVKVTLLAGSAAFLCISAALLLAFSVDFKHIRASPPISGFYIQTKSGMAGVGVSFVLAMLIPFAAGAWIGRYRRETSWKKVALVAAGIAPAVLAAVMVKETLEKYVISVASTYLQLNTMTTGKEQTLRLDPALVRAITGILDDKVGLALITFIVASVVLGISGRSVGAWIRRRATGAEPPGVYARQFAERMLGPARIESRTDTERLERLAKVIEVLGPILPFLGTVFASVLGLFATWLALEAKNQK